MLCGVEREERAMRAVLVEQREKIADDAECSRVQAGRDEALHDPIRIPAASAHEPRERSCAAQ